MTKKMTPERIEKLAVEIRSFLIKHEMWIDTTIYFNGKAFSTYDKEAEEFYYNDPEHLVVRENENPRNYFEYTGDILCISFEGPLYDMLNGCVYQKAHEEFDALIDSYGLYYELGYAWSLALYEK